MKSKNFITSIAKKFNFVVLMLGYFTLGIIISGLVSGKVTVVDLEGNLLYPKQEHVVNHDVKLEATQVEVPNAR